MGPVTASPGLSELTTKLFKVTYGSEPPPAIEAFLELGLTEVGDFRFLANDPASRDGWMEDLWIRACRASGVSVDVGRLWQLAWGVHRWGRRSPGLFFRGD
jgi:hypothetical protein